MDLGSQAVMAIGQRSESPERQQSTPSSQRPDRPDRPEAPDTRAPDRDDNKSESSDFRGELERSEPRKQQDDAPAVDGQEAPHATEVAPEAIVLQEAPIAVLLETERPVDLGNANEEDPLLALANDLLGLPFAAILLDGQNAEDGLAGEENAAQSANAEAALEANLTVLPPGQEQEEQEGDNKLAENTAAIAGMHVVPTDADSESDEGGETIDPLLKLRPEASTGLNQGNERLPQEIQQALGQQQQQLEQEQQVQQAQALQTVQATHQADSVGLGQGEQNQVQSVQGLRPVISPAAAAAAQAQAEAGPADRAIANQISRAVLAELPNGDRVLNLRLTPPELGTVRIQIVEHHGQLTLRMGAEDDGVRHALERSLPQLRQDLRSNDAPIADLQLADSPFFNLHGRDQQQGDGSRKGSRSNGPRFSLDGDMIIDDEAVSKPRHSSVVSADAVDATA